METASKLSFIFKAEVVELLGARTAVEQDGNQKPLPSITAVLVEPFDFRFVQVVRSLGTIMSVELVVQSQRFGRAQPPAEEYLQEYADLHLRVVGIWPIRAFVAKLAGAQRFFKVFDITEHELPRGFIEKFQWNTQPVQIMELPLA